MDNEQVAAAFISAMRKVDAAQRQFVQQLVEFAPTILRVAVEAEAQMAAAEKAVVAVARRWQQFEDDSFAFWEQDI